MDNEEAAALPQQDLKGTLSVFTITSHFQPSTDSPRIAFALQK